MSSKNNNIIKIFNSEKELYNFYPQKSHWYLNYIFDDYWDDFCDYAEKHNLNIRPTVFEEVNKMRICRTKDMGYSVYECPNCHKTLTSYNTCKGRFCNSCGVKYAKQRTTNIMSKLVDTEHRHMVFTMSDSLWYLFQKDRNLLNIVFKAVEITINSWIKEKYKKDKFNHKDKYQAGYILVLHTFGRDDKWNVHIHALVSNRIIGDISDIKVDFWPYDMLRKRWQTVLLKLLDKALKNTADYNDFKRIKNDCYSTYDNGFYVRAKKNEFPNSRKGLEYVLRYCGRPCFASRRIIDIVDNYITFWYQRHEDDKFVVEKVHIFEFIGRLIKHIPNKGFKTIRYCGYYSSKPRKLYNAAKKLIHITKVAFYKTLNKWRNLMVNSFNKDPLKCSCGFIMEYQYSVPRLE